MKAMCLGCKVQVEVKDSREIIMKNGMKAINGSCPLCGRKIYRIIGKA